MKSALLLFAALTLCCLGACATAPYTNRSQVMLYDKDEELRLGEEASRQIFQAVRVEKGTARARRVERVGKAIAAVAERPEFQWEFHTVVRDELNAFCLPGGKIFWFFDVHCGIEEAERRALGNHSHIIELLCFIKGKQTLRLPETFFGTVICEKHFP